jgi:hypothetical protein
MGVLYPDYRKALLVVLVGAGIGFIAYLATTMGMNVTVLLVSMAFVVIEGVTSIRESTCCKMHMYEAGIIKSETEKCLPFYAHGGMWADFFLMSPILGIIVTYHQQWTTVQWIISLIIGFAVAIGMQMQYQKGEPCSTNYGGKTIVGGWLHVVYFAAALATLIQWFCHTTGVSHGHVIVVSAMLAVFFPLGMLQPSWYVHKNFNRQALFQFIAAIVAILVVCIVRFHFFKGAF